MDGNLDRRAALHAALGDPVRLALVDALANSDLSPVELRRRVGIESNLLAHHLDVLEEVGLVERHRSSGDGRRRYVHLRRTLLEDLAVPSRTEPTPALFLCTANSARSQLAARLWSDLTGEVADSAGTHPAQRVHPGAVAAARRAGCDLSSAVPRTLTDHEDLPALVVTVCDRAHEELTSAGDGQRATALDAQRDDSSTAWLHWSVPDPVPDGSAAAFDATVAELRQRISAVVGEPVR